MGYDITRFEGEIDEELLCPICSGVLEDPVQVSHTDNCCIAATNSHYVECCLSSLTVCITLLSQPTFFMTNLCKNQNCYHRFFS